MMNPSECPVAEWEGAEVELEGGSVIADGEGIKVPALWRKEV